MSCLCLANLLQGDLISLATKTFILQPAKLWETNHMAMTILSNVWHRSWTLKVEYIQCRWEIAHLWMNRIDCRVQRHSREKWESRRNNILSFLLLNPWLCLKFFLILYGIKYTSLLELQASVEGGRPCTFRCFCHVWKTSNKKFGFDFVRYFRSFCYMLRVRVRKQISLDVHPLRSWKQLWYLFHQVTGSSHSSHSDSLCHQSPNSHHHLTISYYFL